MTPQRQRALLDRLENRFAKDWRKEIQRAMSASAQAYSSSGSFASVIEAHSKEVVKLLTETYTESGNQFAKPIYEKAQERGMVRKDFENFLRLIQAFIETLGAAKVGLITSTTERQIRDVINAGVAEGLSTAAIASNIRARAPLLAGVRSLVIARTEVHSASQWAQVTAIRDTGLVLRKEWVSAADERTRIDHADANGQIVGPNEAFSVGGESLLFPGDPSGSPENIINCRCVLNFVE